MILQGEKVQLRALEPEDLEFLFTIENDTSFWEISHTQTPFSKFILKQYIENSHLDIYEAKQIRLLIENRNNKTPLGLIDLFDFNPQHKRAGIGIVIQHQYQNTGIATEILSLVIEYCFQILNIHQLFVNITSDNYKSIALFTNHGFKKCGEKKDWLYINGKFKNELLFQLIHE
tara:strand:- start:7547 stop:8068 length:522 start_codon:yes stop_codon:yes gene_type:complete